MENLSITWLGRTPSTLNAAGGSSASRGLDSSILDSFPTFMYSTVKDYREQKYGLECAICLCEFKDEDTLRLLTVCYHVFHHECIDLWLGSHNSCPVCRRSLDVPLKVIENSPANNIGTMHEIDENEALNDSCSINIKEGDHEGTAGGVGSSREEHVTVTTGGHDLQIGAAHTESSAAEKFSRSHSTGHSIAWTKIEEDKHTLILPEHVKAKIVRGHNMSCTAFHDFSSYKNKGKGALDEVSSSNDDNV